MSDEDMKSAAVGLRTAMKDAAQAGQRLHDAFTRLANESVRELPDERKPGALRALAEDFERAAKELHLRAHAGDFVADQKAKHGE